MFLKHGGRSPRIDPSAWVAPDATLCGDVRIGPEVRVMYGARLIATGGEIEIGESSIVMENAVVRSTARHSTRIGANCLIGPGAHVVGARIEEQVFVATHATIFHGSRLGRGCEVRVHAVVHVNSQLALGTTLPIGWIAVGDPARLFPPGRHEEIWAVQQPMNFPLEAYGIDRSEANMVEITQRLSKLLGSHARATPEPREP